MMKNSIRNHQISIVNRFLISALLIVGLLVVGCVPVKYEVLVKDIKETYPGQPEGYLSSFELPNSRSLLPPPPQPGVFSNESRPGNIRYVS